MKKRMHAACLMAAIAATATLSLGAHADVLLIEGVETSRQSADVRPQRGVNMDRVVAQFGEPNTRSGAVGEPPITRWDYPGFSVYFERNLVIHSVERR